MHKITDGSRTRSYYTPEALKEAEKLFKSGDRSVVVLRKMEEVDRRAKTTCGRASNGAKIARNREAVAARGAQSVRRGRSPGTGQTRRMRPGSGVASA